MPARASQLRALDFHSAYCRATLSLLLLRAEGLFRLPRQPPLIYRPPIDFGLFRRIGTTYFSRWAADAIVTPATKMPGLGRRLPRRA